MFKGGFLHSVQVTLSYRKSFICCTLVLIGFEICVECLLPSFELVFQFLLVPLPCGFNTRNPLVILSSRSLSHKFKISVFFKQNL